MRLNKVKRTIICVGLIATMMAGLSITASAGSGSIGYGGFSVRWNMSTSSMGTTVTYTSSAKIVTTGKVCEKDSGGHVKYADCGGSVNASSTLSYSDYPDSGYKFIDDDRNEIKVKINGNQVASYSPRP